MNLPFKFNQRYDNLFNGDASMAHYLFSFIDESIAPSGNQREIVFWEANRLPFMSKSK
jgi:hypothetical protein